MAHLGPVLEETGGTWRGFVAGPEEARARVALTLEAAGIPLVQSVEMDRSGHAAYFTRKSGELILIPTDAILN